jgi:hypothetical protein
MIIGHTYSAAEIDQKFLDWQARLHTRHLAKLGIPACLPQPGVSCFRCWFARMLRVIFLRLKIIFNQGPSLCWTQQVKHAVVLKLRQLVADQRQTVRDRRQTWLARDHAVIQPQDF